MKQDLTEYSDNELSLVIFNDENWYMQRHHIGFLENIKQYYKFTSKQMEILEQDLEDDLKELQKEGD